MSGMRIGQLAARADVGVETVRYYQRRGLLREPDKPLGGSRRYDAGDLARLHFIRRAKALGFTLAEIADLLQLSEADCADVEALAQRKRTAVARRIEDLQRIATVLDAVLARCHQRRAHEGCPIIATLSSSSNR